MYKKLLIEIKKHNKIIIHRHQKPDGDALGSQLGLKEIISYNFPNKIVLSYGSREEIEKNSIKNIFKDEFDKISDDDYKDSLVIVVDTANIERIEGKNFYLGLSVIKIDHHRTSEEFGDFEIIEDDVSSTSEIITRFARVTKLKISKKAATFLLTGMITDTGRFMYNSVKSETFYEASILLESGAKPSNITNVLNDRDINFIRLQGKILTDLEYKNGISSYMMPKNMHKKYNVDYDSASSSIFMLMSFSEANYAIYSTFDNENNIWKGSLRSRKKPINKIAEEHNGGGHEMAAGFKVKDKKEFKVILEKLKSLNNE